MLRSSIQYNDVGLNIDVTPIITHRYPLDAYKEAFRSTHDQGTSGAVKVLFEFA